jgi:hypothetical protein
VPLKGSPWFFKDKLYQSKPSSFKDDPAPDPKVKAVRRKVLVKTSTFESLPDRFAEEQAKAKM